MRLISDANLACSLACPLRGSAMIRTGYTIALAPARASFDFFEASLASLVRGVLPTFLIVITFRSIFTKLRGGLMALQAHSIRCPVRTHDLSTVVFRATFCNTCWTAPFVKANGTPTKSQNSKPRYSSVPRIECRSGPAFLVSALRARLFPPICAMTF